MVLGAWTGHAVETLAVEHGAARHRMLLPVWFVVPGDRKLVKSIQNFLSSTL